MRGICMKKGEKKARILIVEKNTLYLRALQSVSWKIRADDWFETL